MRLEGESSARNTQNHKWLQLKWRADSLRRHPHHKFWRQVLTSATRPNQWTRLSVRVETEAVKGWLGLQTTFTKGWWVSVFIKPSLVIFGANGEKAMLITAKVVVPPSVVPTKGEFFAGWKTKIFSMAHETVRFSFRNCYWGIFWIWRHWLKSSS